MPERYERLLRLICLILGGMLLLRVGWVVIHHNPLAHLKIPAVPTLAASDSTAGGKTTNNVPRSDATRKSTNTLGAELPGKATNSVASLQVAKGATNHSQESALGKQLTNAIAAIQLAKGGTNAVTGTNAF